MEMVIIGFLMTCGFGLLVYFLWGFLVSLREKELQAASRLLVMSILIPSFYIAIALLKYPFHGPVSYLLSIITICFLFLLISPLGSQKASMQQKIINKIDERDTMFSRKELVPGSPAYSAYYNKHPERKSLDDIFRKKPGLLKEGSSQYNPFQFASAGASFEIIGVLKNRVEGNISSKKIQIKESEITRYIKNWSKKLGAIDCGITELKPYHLYSVGGRAERRDQEIINNHSYAIAFTVEMDKEMVDAAPSGAIVMESALQYLESGTIALQVASFIRKLGFDARAHIDGNYQVVCPLVAKDAGLGEIGRMGLLMTPHLGPRVRISVVTTDLPLLNDIPSNDYSVIDFCEKCKKCADSCPSNAISFNPREEIEGSKRWKINQEACFTLWCQLGTDCGRCIRVCPYAHPDNSFHNIIRKGLKNSSFFRYIALKMDDFLYGKKPPTIPLPKWLNIPERH